MDQTWSGEDFARLWSLSFSERSFIEEKPAHHRLGLAVQLKQYCYNGRFVKKLGDVSVEPAHYLAEQLDAGIGDFSTYEAWCGGSCDFGQKLEHTKNI